MSKRVVSLLALAAPVAAYGINKVKPDLLGIPPEKLYEKYVNSESRFTNMNGLKVHYRDEGDGFPILLLHGLGSSLHTWDEWANRLKQHYRVIRLDLPGFGLTGPNKEHAYTQADQVAFLERFLDRIGVQKCHIAGNSMGGWISWWFAYNHPHRVERLALLNALVYPMQNITSLGIRLARMPIMKQFAKYMTPRSIVVQSVKQVYRNKSLITPELIQRYYDMLLRKGNRHAFVACCNGIYWKNTPRIKNLQTPTLVMWGSKDLWIPVEHAYRLKEDIPNAKLVVYNGVGHVPMEEVPARSAQDFRSFIEQ